MCGIAGEIALEPPTQVDLSAVTRMASVLAHRGPDGWGFYIGPRRGVSLVNLRLAIVDIPNGDQPISNESKTVWVTLNGELYGFAGIRRDLESRGHKFRTNSDTEVIVHLYEEYGEGFVEHLTKFFGGLELIQSIDAWWSRDLIVAPSKVALANLTAIGKALKKNALYLNSS